MKTRPRSSTTAATTKSKKKKTVPTKEKIQEVKKADGNDVDGPWYRVFTKGDEEYGQYMAAEWGFEKRGTQALFEKVSLEGAQSGLSWLTILRKREAYRRVFHGFDIEKVAGMTTKDIDRILQEDDPITRNMVVRHRGKIESVINNARCIQQIIDENKNDNAKDVFDEFLWSFVEDQPILNRWNGIMKDANTQTEQSQAMSKTLKKCGFRFVGPTTCYAMMQSVGMVIDHPVDSPEWKAAYERLQTRPGGFQEL